MSTKVDYIFEVMRSDNLIFFTIMDFKGNYLKDQRNENYSVENSIDEIKNFLKFNEGVFTIELRHREKRGGNVKNFVYQVKNFIQAENAGSPMIGSVNPGMPSGNEFFHLLMEREREIKDLQATKMMDLMEHLKNENALRTELLKKEIEEQNKNKDDKFQEMALMTLTGILGGGTGINVGVSGVGESIPANEAERIKINSAIKKLRALDINFAQNIEHLSILAERKPEIYQMAIKQLNSLL